eukprot:3709219-Rhodomonas_salina.5
MAPCFSKLLRHELSKTPLQCSALFARVSVRLWSLQGKERKKREKRMKNESRGRDGKPWACASRGSPTASRCCHRRSCQRAHTATSQGERANRWRGRGGMGSQSAPQLQADMRLKPT